MACRLWPRPIPAMSPNQPPTHLLPSRHCPMAAFKPIPQPANLTAADRLLNQLALQSGQTISWRPRARSSTLASPVPPPAGCCHQLVSACVCVEGAALGKYQSAVEGGEGGSAPQLAGAPRRRRSHSIRGLPSSACGGVTPLSPPPSSLS